MGQGRGHSLFPTSFLASNDLARPLPKIKAEGDKGFHCHSLGDRSGRHPRPEPLGPLDEVTTTTTHRAQPGIMVGLEKLHPERGCKMHTHLTRATPRTHQELATPKICSLQGCQTSRPSWLQRIRPRSRRGGAAVRLRTERNEQLAHAHSGGCWVFGLLSA